jgi:hypothetical protein
LEEIEFTDIETNITFVSCFCSAFSIFSVSRSGAMPACLFNGKAAESKKRIHFSYRNRFNPTSAFYNAEVGLKEMSRSLAGLGVLLILLMQISSH